MFFARLTAFFTALMTMLSAIFCPSVTEATGFPETAEKTKTVFNEGDFIMGEYDLVVSPDGNDNNDGSLLSPLKTPEEAKERLKELRTETDENVTVWFREGTYFIEKTLSFSSDDLNNVTYRSYPYEEVNFSGAKAFSDWEETKINGVTAFVTDAATEGDKDYFRSLFKGNTRLPRSCYPKSGYLKVMDPKTDEAVVPQIDGSFFTHSLVFYGHKEDLKGFSNEKDIDVRIMHFWCDDLLGVYSIDESTGRIEMTKPSAMTIREEDNYILENVKEALSLPGEWYLDRSEDKLYYIPQEGDTTENTVLYAGSVKQLITMDGAKNISFQGIDFEKTDWETPGKESSFSGMVFEPSHPLYKNIEYGATHPQAAFEVPAAIYICNSEGIYFTDCIFENISYSAIKFDKATKNCSVTSCSFNDIGGNAIFIHGDFAVPATTNNIDVTDCHIGFYGRIFNNAIGILLTYASDCNLTHNEIHDGWYTGISSGWVWGYSDNPANNINISNNLIYNIGNGWLSDMGAIYTLGVQPDSVIRENIIYNVGCDEGRYGYGGWGIYLDEGTSGMLVEKNLVYDCSSQTFHQHYGKDNIVRNNIFAFGGDGAFRITRHEEHNSLTLSNNILVTNDAAMYALTTEKDWFVDNSNLYWDYKNGGNVFSGDSTKLLGRKNIVNMTVRGYYNNASFSDPLFRDIDNRDFTLAVNSPAFLTGFEVWEYNAGTLTRFEY